MADNVPHNPLEGQRPDLSIDLHNGTDELVSIVIVHKDSPAYLNICLQSIAVTSVNNNYELIVVDNGSEKETQDYLDSLEETSPNIKIIRNEKNLYWSAAANKGAEAASKNSKYLVFLHHDVVITNPSWLDLLINVCDTNNAGMLGLEMQAYVMQGKKIDFIREWMVCFTRECFEDCGPWPEKLPIIGPSFIMTLRANHKGYRPQIMKNSLAHHYKIFAIDINEFERYTEQAMIAIPQLMRDLQTETVKKVI